MVVCNFAGLFPHLGRAQIILEKSMNKIPREAWDNPASLFCLYVFVFLFPILSKQEFADERCYSAAISACAQAHRWRHALGTFAAIDRANLRTHLISYAIALVWAAS